MINRIAVLLTSYNRREKTLACLSALFEAVDPSLHALDVYLVDDGGTDGTAQAVASAFPAVHIHRSPGNLYWCRGMRLAQSLALGKPHDFQLWLNDDVLLVRSAISDLLALHAASPPRSIIVGATLDRAAGSITYGGFSSRSRINPLRFERAWDSQVPVECSAMNGNVVLVPLETVQAVGLLDDTFEHAMGDIDYALRARKLGILVIGAPGVAGFCSSNSPKGTLHDKSLPMAARFRMALQPKGLPPRSWLHLVRRHGGLAWPLLFVWPYLRLVAGR